MITKSEYTLNEKDSLMDMLNLEKTMLKVYATAYSEGASKGFRSEMSKSINEIASNQQKVFLTMTNKGYAKVESAPNTELNEQRTKFSKIKSTLQ